MPSSRNSSPEPDRTPGAHPEGEAFYRALYELSNDGIMLLQNDRFLDCNKRLLEMLGRRRDEIIGHTPWEISPAVQPDGINSSQKASAYIERGLKGERQMFEWVHTRADGTEINIEVSLAKIDYQGQPALLCHLRDITQRKRMETALKQREEQYRRIVQDQLDFIVRWLPDGTRTFVNDSYCRFFGKSRQELIGQSFFPLIPKEQQQAIRDKIASLSPNQPVATDVHQAIVPGGELRWQQWIDRGFFNSEGRLIALQSVGRDIHDQKTAEEALRLSEEKFSKAFHASPESILITRMRDGVVLELNEGFRRMSGYSAEEALGRSTVELGIWPDPQRRARLVELVRKHGRVTDYEAVLRSKTGELRQCVTSVQTITINGEDCMLSVTRDVTDQNKIRTALEYQANHDSLTGLPNRHWLTQRIQQRITPRAAPFALILVDLDHFKEINDSVGHHSGDLILRQIGKRLQPITERLDADLVRLGGDEFAILLPGANDRSTVAAAADKIIEALRRGFTVEGLHLELSASLGSALFPLHGDDAHTLLRCADVAMYVAKENRSGHAMYQAKDDKHSPRRLALISQLRQAIETNQLCLHYQPQIDLGTMKVYGVEALVRWQHPQHGLIPPAQFVQFAELGATIHPLTYWILDGAMAQRHAWSAQGLDLSMSVNLSTRNLLDETCGEAIARLLEQHTLAAQRLTVEITESAMIHDPERVLKNLHRIHDMGVKIAVDDYGSGYSSMAYLKRMPLDILKIDLSFVTHMLSSPQDEILVKSTVNLGHNLGLHVIAEGVENQATLDALRDYDCDAVQGFFMTEPLPPAQLLHWINAHH